jgi:hypothetical protein
MEGCLASGGPYCLVGMKLDLYPSSVPTSTTMLKVENFFVGMSRLEMLLMLASIRHILLLSTRMSAGILCLLLAMTWSVFSEPFLVTFAKVHRTSTPICLILSTQCRVLQKYTMFCLCKTDLTFCFLTCI